MAYAQVLQYCAEKVRLPTFLDYHPLVMSIVKLMQQVKGHITFYKQDVFQNLGRITLESVSQDTVIPQGDPITLPPSTDVGGMESNSTENWGHMAPPPHYSNIHLRRRPHQLNPLPCLQG